MLWTAKREIVKSCGLELDHALAVLSLTKNFGLIPQKDRFERRVARSDVSDYKVLERGWIAYNPMVIWEGAIHALWGSDRGLVSPVYAVWVVKEADWRYLDYLLKTPQVLREFLRLSSGVVKRRRTIKKDAFLDIALPMPPIEEQRVIADALTTVKSSMEQTEQVLAAAQALKLSLSQNSVGMARSNDVISQRNKPLETELNELVAVSPKNGLYKPLSEYGSGRPIVRMTDFGVEGAILHGAAHRIRASEKEVEQYRLEEGDIVVNRVNSVQYLGKAALMGSMTESVLFESNTMRVRVDRSKVLPEYVYRFLASPRGRQQLVARAKRAGEIVKSCGLELDHAASFSFS